MGKHNGSASKLPSVPGSSTGGRPTIYSEELASEICARLSEGTALKVICKAEDMPCERSVMRWLFDEVAERDGFGQRYAQARQAQAELLFDETLTIADDCKEESPAINKARLRVDVRHKAAAVFNPERFSDKRQGGTVAGTVVVQINLGPKPKPAVTLDNGEVQPPQLPKGKA